MSDLRMELIQGQLNDIEENVRSIKVTWGNTIMTLDNIKSSLKADRQKAIEEAYQKGFEAGQHEATTLEYQQGLNDAWACAKKIFGYEIDGGLPLDELRNVFGVKDVPFDIFRINTASEALAKIKAYEEQQKPAKIVVGDEVRNTLGLMDNAVGYVIGTTIEGDYNVSRYIDGKIKTGTWRRENCVKTGKHSDTVVQLLAEMEGGAE